MTHTETTTMEVESTSDRWYAAHKDWRFDSAVSHGRGPTLEEPAQHALPPMSQGQPVPDIPGGTIVEADGTFYRWHAPTQSWYFDSAVAHGRGPTLEEPAQHAPSPASQEQPTPDIPDGTIVEVDGTFYRWHAVPQSWHFDSAVAHGREALAPLPTVTRGDPQGRAALPSLPFYAAFFIHSLMLRESFYDK